MREADVEAGSEGGADGAVACREGVSECTVGTRVGAKVGRWGGGTAAQEAVVAWVRVFVAHLCLKVISK